ncbi:COX15/CtaA family protein [Phytohabitans aurantiacus]|uniref:COX15/CtaA family protein n=1 Tax=Phytohabitans aurantiacus TaxID=3016789 RepID=UPI00389A9592
MTVLPRLALTSVVANVAIVVTGGAVRLTDSGLGCPTWPRCTDQSYTANQEMGIHGAIEFGNRLLGVVVVGVAIACLVGALRRRPRQRRLVWLSGAVVFGVFAQILIGGLTVLTTLNPWLVGVHFLGSMAVLIAAYAFWRALRAPVTPEAIPGPLRALGWVIVAVTTATITVGTWVTGSGPHAGDHGAARIDIDAETISQVHADLVFLLIGLSVAAWLALWGIGAQRAAKAALVLVAVELAQGLIGLVQYFTGLPEILVGAHMLGASLVWLATLALLANLADVRFQTRLIDMTPARSADYSVK